MHVKDQKEIRRIMISVNRIDGMYYRFAKRIGIKENTLQLFYALSDGMEHSQKSICDEWLVPRTTINTVVRECVEGGFVYLKRSHGEKEKMLSLTPKGQEYAGILMDELFECEREAYIAACNEHGDDFVSALRCFTDALERSLTDKATFDNKTKEMQS